MTGSQWSSGYFHTEVMTFIESNSVDFALVTADSSTYWVILSESESEVSQSCPSLCNPMDYIAHQAPLSMGFSRQEYWRFSRGSSQPRDWTQVSHIADRRFTIWATREAPVILSKSKLLLLSFLFFEMRRLKHRNSDCMKILRTTMLCMWILLLPQEYQKLFLVE